MKKRARLRKIKNMKVTKEKERERERERKRMRERERKREKERERERKREKEREIKGKISACMSAQETIRTSDGVFDKIAIALAAEHGRSDRRFFRFRRRLRRRSR